MTDTIATDKWGLWLQPFTGSRTARQLLAAFDEFGWRHNGQEWGINGTGYTYVRGYLRDENEIIQVILDDDGHWFGCCSWWTISVPVALQAIHDGKHWLEVSEHYREPSRHAELMSEAMAVICRQRFIDCPLPKPGLHY